MSDNITLPREVGEHLTKMLEECPLIPNADWSERDCDALNALRTALAAEQPKPSEDVEALRRDAERYRWLREKDGIAVDVTVFGSMEANLDAAIDAAMKENKR